MINIVIILALAALTLNLLYEFYLIAKESKKVKFLMFRSKHLTDNKIIKQELLLDIKHYYHILLPVFAVIATFILLVNDYSPLTLSLMLILTIIIVVLSSAIKTNKHKKIILKNLPEAIENFCNTMSTSSDVYRSLDYAAKNAPYPLNTILYDITNKYILEHDIESSIIKTTKKLRIIELTFFCILLQTYLKIGGNAITPLVNFAKNLKESIQFSKKLAAAFSSSISQATFLFLFPFVLLILYYFMKPDLIMGVYNNELAFIALVILLSINLICLFYMHFSLKKKTIC